MPTGRYLDDGAVPTITIAGMDGANDRFLVHDDSNTATPTSQMVASQILDRLLSTASISHLTAMAAISSVDLAADEVLVFDTSTTRLVRVPAEQAIGRILTRANITGLSNFSALTSIDGTNDRFLIWDASAAAFVTATASALLNSLNSVTLDTYTSTPVTVSSSTMQTVVINNNGATQVIRFNLPTATAGTRFSFARIANYAMQIDPSGSEVIGEGAAGKYLEMRSNNSRLDIRCLVNSAWVVESISGSYGYEA